MPQKNILLRRILLTARLTHKFRAGITLALDKSGRRADELRAGSVKRCRCQGLMIPATSASHP